MSIIDKTIIAISIVVATIFMISTILQILTEGRKLKKMWKDFDNEENNKGDD